MNSDTMRCPTCRAVQAWSDICRRCKSDLQLVREVEVEYTAARQLCLSNLRNNRIHAALEQARHCLTLRDDAENRRLLAVCELLSGHWAEARAQAIQLLSQG